MTIEGLLAWAFCQELCKVGSGGDRVPLGGGSAWSMVSEYAALGTLIDRSPNDHGVIPGFLEEGDPHPDALLVAEVVDKLPEARFHIGPDWKPFPEFHDEHGLIAAEVARVVSEVNINRERIGSSHIRGLVVRAAILRRGPDWRCDQPRFLPIKRNGKECWFISQEVRDSLGRVYLHEVNGYDVKRGRPMSGAYRRFELAEPIYAEVYARLDWQLWQDALHKIAEELQGRLAEHRIMPFTPDRQPWKRTKRGVAVSEAIEKAS